MTIAFGILAALEIAPVGVIYFATSDAVAIAALTFGNTALNLITVLYLQKVHKKVKQTRNAARESAEELRDMANGIDE